MLSHNSPFDLQSHNIERIMRGAATSKRCVVMCSASHPQVTKAKMKRCDGAIASSSLWANIHRSNPSQIQPISSWQEADGRINDLLCKGGGEETPNFSRSAEVVEARRRRKEHHDYQRRKHNTHAGTSTINVGKACAHLPRGNGFRCCSKTLGNHRTTTSRPSRSINKATAEFHTRSVTLA